MTFDATTMLAANMVIWRRMPIIFGHLVSPTPKSGREMNRMVLEKMAAAGEGLALMPEAAFAATRAMAAAIHQGTPPPLALARGVEAGTRAILSPGGRRVRANARRLYGKH